MTGTLTITCPTCKKVMQVPAVLGGKRIRCRGCGQTVAVPKPGSAGKPAAQTVRTNKAGEHFDDEWAQAQAYGVLKDEDKPRCPFCASDVEEGQVICLKCGYNLRTRERHSTRIVNVVTGMDYFLWLLPGIACLLVGFGCIAWIVILAIGSPRLGDAAELLQDWRWGMVYGILFGVFILYLTGRFAIKRLIINPHPPEVEKHDADEEDDDEDYEEDEDEVDEDEEEEDDDDEAKDKRK